MKIHPKMPCSSAGSWRTKFGRKFNKMARKFTRLCKVPTDEKTLFLHVIVTILTTVAIILLIFLLLARDSCNGQKIKEALCKEYNNGLISGDLCYQICVEESFLLDSCYSETETDVSYRFEDVLVKLQRYPFSDPLPNPVSIKAFQDKVIEYLEENLGKMDISGLMEKVLEYADLNTNGDLNYAECNSMWQLLNVRQFFMMFIFQHETFFPHINGTCGSAFAYDYIPNSPLYSKKTDSNRLVQYFFPNYNQWTLPSWEKRAMVAVGLLEFSSALSESYSTRFYMCDVQHTNFAVSSEYEAKVVTFGSLISDQQLSHLGKNKRCYFDSECFYGNGCNMMCDINSRTCSNIPSRPPVSLICDILKDYILYDSPDEFKFRFETLISQCQSLTSTNQTIYQNIIPDKINAILWDQVKNKPVNYFNPRKNRKKRSKPTSSPK